MNSYFILFRFTSKNSLGNWSDIFRCDFPRPDCSKCHCRTTDDGYKANGKGGGIFSSPTREEEEENLSSDQLAVLLCLTCGGTFQTSYH